MALLDLSKMAEVFTKLSLVTLKKSSTCFSKFLNNFIKKALVLSNGCNYKCAEYQTPQYSDVAKDGGIRGGIL